METIYKYEKYVQAPYNITSKLIDETVEKGLATRHSSITKMKNILTGICKA